MEVVGKTQDPQFPQHWIADEGKVFYCIITQQIMGNEIVLDKILINGVMVQDSIDNYTEIDDPNPPIEPNQEQ